MSVHELMSVLRAESSQILNEEVSLGEAYQWTNGDITDSVIKGCIGSYLKDTSEDVKIIPGEWSQSGEVSFGEDSTAVFTNEVSVECWSEETSKDEKLESVKVTVTITNTEGEVSVTVQTDTSEGKLKKTGKIPQDKIFTSSGKEFDSSVINGWVLVWTDLKMQLKNKYHKEGSVSEKPAPKAEMVSKDLSPEAKALVEFVKKNQAEIDNNHDITTFFIDTKAEYDKFNLTVPGICLVVKDKRATVASLKKEPIVQKFDKSKTLKRYQDWKKSTLPNVDGQEIKDVVWYTIYISASEARKNSIKALREETDYPCIGYLTEEGSLMAYPQEGFEYEVEGKTYLCEEVDGNFMKLTGDEETLTDVPALEEELELDYTDEVGSYMGDLVCIGALEESLAYADEDGNVYLLESSYKDGFIGKEMQAFIQDIVEKSKVNLKHKGNEGKAFGSINKGEYTEKYSFKDYPDAEVSISVKSDGKKLTLRTASYKGSFPISLKKGQVNISEMDDGFYSSVFDDFVKGSIHSLKEVVKKLEK